MTKTWLADRRHYALLGLLCLCLYLPGLAAIPVTDRDEARFAQASRQMLEAGDFLHIRFQDEARNNKPAGIYWLQAVSVVAFSTAKSSAIWPYRLPSLIAAGLAAMFTFGFGRALLGDPCRALTGAVLLATALVTISEAHLAKTDAALLAAVAAGQGALGLAYTRARAGAAAGWGVAAAFWLAEIVAIYVKGPVGPGIAIATALTLSVADRDWRWLRGLRPLAGVAVVVLAVAPWLWAIEHATQGQFLDQSMGHDFWSKVMGGQEAHGAPPLSYLGLAFLTFWPGSLYLVPAVIGGWTRRAEPAARFLMAWLVPAWIVLELVPTKLPHYPLPLYPALALLAANALGNVRPLSRWARGVTMAGNVLWGLATLLIAGALIAMPVRFDDGVTRAAIAGAIVVLLLSAVLFRNRRAPTQAILSLAALAVAFVVSASFVLPNLDRLWLSRGAAALVAQHPPPAGGKLAVAGYNEPSLVFLLDDNFTAGMADMSVGAGDEALVTDRIAPDFTRHLATLGLTAQPLGAVSGVDYSNGERMILTLYKIAAQ